MITKCQTPFQVFCSLILSLFQISSSSSPSKTSKDGVMFDEILSKWTSWGEMYERWGQVCMHGWIALQVMKCGQN